ncbi:hypothetical protein LIPSTDRAFT_76677 [Lipomyces starkeyi NRRL Y-11557]|uniref:HTH CENPB-type domain-containing protein n=1 Tax=Lipomyces starkeyi NRRL Y-11557 TaxID=675824 RepID=A0A1E3PTT6_LIPST|nr:hypothetical protein LIPSTDRAFT_76677 [Lipomyces starkeyi NRRL Y-11557]
MDKRGFPPRVADVRKVADLLLTKRAESASQEPIKVDEKWVRNFYPTTSVPFFAPLRIAINIFIKCS